MIVIREAHPDEYVQAGTLTFRGFGHAEPGAVQPDTARRKLLLDAAARAQQGALLVAVTSRGELVGTASLLPAGSSLTRQAQEHEAELRLLAVLPQARRMGAGTLLMRDAVTRASQWGAQALVLDTSPVNVHSQRLYHSLAFDRVLQRETTAFRGGGTLAVFRQDLTNAPGLWLRLLRGSARAHALQAAIADERAQPNGVHNGVVDDDQSDLWRIEDRATGRPTAIVRTPRLDSSLAAFAASGADRLSGSVDTAARHARGGLTNHVHFLTRPEDDDAVSCARHLCSILERASVAHATLRPHPQKGTIAHV